MTSILPTPTPGDFDTVPALCVPPIPQVPEALEWTEAEKSALASWKSWGEG